MNETREILRAINESSSSAPESLSDEPLVLATVVDVVGSAYRRPTARMLVLPNGHHIGSISGGCLERDLCRAAVELTERGPKLISFDTRHDSTNFNPRYNLGCSGIIYVLVERITRDAECPAEVLRRVFDRRRAEVMATVYQNESLELGAVGRRFFSLGELPVDSRLESIWEQVRFEGRPICCELTTKRGSTRMLIEKVSPPTPLWIFGAGDDCQPLAEMAWQLGWDVTVVDHQASKLTKKRFPHARLVCSPWDRALDSLEQNPETNVVLMTHSFDADKLLLPSLAAADNSYIGILGPKSRTGSLLRELHSSGALPVPSMLDKLRTPVGLDLGASTPAEIAVSILGEIIALRNERTGGLLRDRQDPIHEPVRHELIECSRRSVES